MFTVQNVNFKFLTFPTFGTLQWQNKTQKSKSVSKVPFVSFLHKLLHSSAVAEWLGNCQLLVVVLVVKYSIGTALIWSSVDSGCTSILLMTERLSLETDSYPLFHGTFTIVALTFPSLHGSNSSTLPNFQKALEVDSSLRMTMSPTVKVPMNRKLFSFSFKDYL